MSLGLHHVRDLPSHVPLYDWIFLLVGGVGLLLVGVETRSVAGTAARANGTRRRVTQNSNVRVSARARGRHPTLDAARSRTRDSAKLDPVEHILPFSKCHRGDRHCAASSSPALSSSDSARSFVFS
jgi:hypothetical protein